MGLAGQACALASPAQRSSATLASAAPKTVRNFWFLRKWM